MRRVSEKDCNIPLRERKPADCRQRLAQCSNPNIDELRVEAEMLDRPSSVSPEHPDRVRIVDEEEGAVAPCQTGDLRERADVSVHGIHAVDRYQPPPNRGRPLEDEIQMVEVVVSEPTDGRAREKRAVVDGAMCLPVDDDQVPGSEQPR